MVFCPPAEVLMVHKNKWQEMLYRATYDKPGSNRRAFAFKKSLDEVKKTLQEKGTPRKNH